jgi:hypothetical protein
LGQAVDPAVGDDLAAQGPQVADQGVGQRLGSPARKRPAEGVPERSQQQRDGGGEGLVQGQHRVAGHAAEKGPGRDTPEAEAGHSGGRPHGLDAEHGHRDGMVRHPERAMHGLQEPVDVCDQGPEQEPVSAPVGSQPLARLGQVAVQDGRLAAVERVGQGNVRLDQFQAVLAQGDGAQEKRAGGQGMDCRADVVDEAGEGQRRRSATATRGRCCFQHLD